MHFITTHTSFFLIIVFICGCAGLHCCAGFSPVVVSSEQGLLSSCGAWAPRCSGFTCGAQASAAAVCWLSSCSSRALERRLGSCGTRAQLLHGIWDLPR